MKTNNFNICPSCTHRNTCVLTAHKDKVWSCSEFEEVQYNKSSLKTTKQQERKLHFV